MNRLLLHIAPRSFGYAIRTGLISAFAMRLYRQNKRKVFGDYNCFPLRTANVVSLYSKRSDNISARTGVGQIFSRFTWELPQTLIGLIYSKIRVGIGQVDKVRYFDGATYVIKITKVKEDGISISNFININSPKIPTNENGKFMPYLDPLYMHEYGHYLQSQKYGWGYLFNVGIPSIISAKKSKAIAEPPFTTHRSNWMEKSANRKAKTYFEKYYGIDWNSSYIHPKHPRLTWTTIEDYYPTN